MKKVKIQIKKINLKKEVISRLNFTQLNMLNGGGVPPVTARPTAESGGIITTFNPCASNDTTNGC
jgi:hypothetical protein